MGSAVFIPAGPGNGGLTVAVSALPAGFSTRFGDGRLMLQPPRPAAGHALTQSAPRPHGTRRTTRLINISSCISIHRPLKEVFDFVSSADNNLRWQQGTLASGQVSAGASGVGTLFRTLGHLVGRRVVSTFEITEHAPNQLYGFKSLTGPLHSHTRFDLRSVGNRTTVEVSTAARPGRALQIREGALQSYMGARLREDLRQLKSVMETR
jgi:hypothetical protein